MGADDDTREWVTPEVFAARLKDKQLACRELGHKWAPSTVRVLVNRGRVGGYERTMRCPSCKSERRQLLDSTGSVLKNGYNYADGYLADHVQKGFTRDTFRLEAVARFVDAHPEAVSQEVWEEGA